MIGSISVGGLHYRLCYSIKFVALKEGLGLQLLAQNSKIFYRFCVYIVKTLNCRASDPGPLVVNYGPHVPLVVIQGPRGPLVVS